MFTSKALFSLGLNALGLSYCNWKFWITKTYPEKNISKSNCVHIYIYIYIYIYVYIYSLIFQIDFLSGCCRKVVQIACNMWYLAATILVVQGKSSFVQFSYFHHSSGVTTNCAHLLYLHVFQWSVLNCIMGLRTLIFDATNKKPVGFCVMIWACCSLLWHQ